MITQLTHKNHYVPQFYLKRWSSDGKKILCYRTLVSHENVPFWSLNSIEWSFFVTDLYTSMLRGQFTDNFERWIKEIYEEPALSAICKLEAGKKLTTENINNLVQFLALQDIRTPQNYFETLSHFKNNFPEVADKVLKELNKKLEKGNIHDFNTYPKKDNQFASAISVKAFPIDNEEIRGIQLKISASFDRDIWINEQKHLLNNIAKRLLSHSWSILETAPSMDWYASDHPVVRLNYYGSHNYDLRGGWANKKGNVFMPLTSKYLLFTQIGDSVVNNPVLSEEKTLELNDIILKRAFRFIFSVREMNRVKKVRHRIVNSDLLKEEVEFWQGWQVT